MKTHTNTIIAVALTLLLLIGCGAAGAGSLLVAGAFASFEAARRSAMDLAVTERELADREALAEKQAAAAEAARKAAEQDQR